MRAYIHGGGEGGGGGGTTFLTREKIKSFSCAPDRIRTLDLRIPSPQRL